MLEPTTFRYLQPGRIISMGARLSITPVITRALPCTRAPTAPHSLSLCHTHSHTHTHTIAAFTVLSYGSSRNISAANQTQRHSRLSASSTPSPPRSSSSSSSEPLAQRQRFWWTVPGGGRPVPTAQHREEAHRSQVGHFSVETSCPFPRISYTRVPLSLWLRVRRCTGSSVKKTAFRPLATSRPPSSGLHLWLVDIQLLPRQIPYLHASLSLVRFATCLCAHWFKIYLITFVIGHITGGRHCIV